MLASFIVSAIFAAERRRNSQNQPTMLEWLLEKGVSPQLTDQSGDTALIHAVEKQSVEAVNLLLNAGVDVNHRTMGRTALGLCATREIVMLLLEAGADPQELAGEGRRALLGFDQNWETAFESLTIDDFHIGRTQRFGESNPEKIEDPFWEGMIRAGVAATTATHWFLEKSHLGVCPVWCAQRFGQSRTLLDDGRIIEIAGEHEDYYDPNFLIYNDVFVHEPDGKISVFG
jgi:Ankyrin repeats (3 copies)